MSCENVFKTSSRRLQDLLQRYIQDVFKTYNQVKLFLLTSLREVLQKQLSSEGFGQVTLLRNLWSVYKICKSDKNFSSFSFFTTPFSGYRGIFTTPFSGYRGAFRNLSNIYKLVTISAKTAPSQMLDWVQNRLLAKGLKY